MKWTALSFFVFFVILSLVWDRAALQAAGVRAPDPALDAPFGTARVRSFNRWYPVAAYLLTYLGWFTGENAWNRHWADTHRSTAQLDLVGVHDPVQLGLGTRPDPVAR